MQVQMDKLVDEIGADGSDESSGFFATSIRPYLARGPGVVADQHGAASPPPPADELDEAGDDDDIDSDIDLDLGGDDLGLGV